MTLARRAFTLLELLVAMTLGTILIGVVAFVFTQSSRIYDTTLEEVHATQVLRASFDLIGKDLRGVVIPRDTDMDMKITSADDANGNPQDTLEYCTVEPTPTGPNLIVVRLSLDTNTNYVVREVIRRWNGASFDTVSEPSDLCGRVDGFAVEYSWPGQTPTSTSPPIPASFNGAPRWVRGDMAGAPTASDGSLFVFRSVGTVADDGLLTSTTTWHSSLAPPQRLGKTLHLLHDLQQGAFRVSAVEGTDTIRLDHAIGAADATFILPLYPKAVRLTLRHRELDGQKTRTLIRVLPITH
jgi:prepilin-type N-terminal cleavage/methylation domain-containing protein